MKLEAAEAQAREAALREVLQGLLQKVIMCAARGRVARSAWTAITTETGHDLQSIACLTVQIAVACYHYVLGDCS